MRTAMDGATVRAVFLPVVAGLFIRAIPVVTADYEGVPEAEARK